MHYNMKKCKSSIDETFIYFAPLPKYILLPVFQITPFGVGDDGYYWLQMSQIDSFPFVKEKKKKRKRLYFDIFIMGRNVLIYSFFKKIVLFIHPSINVIL